MIRAFVAALCFLFSAPLWAACDGPSRFDALPEQMQAALISDAQSDPFGTGLFWSARKGGVTSYVLGTLHLPDRRHAQILDGVRPVLEQVDTLVMEINTEDRIAFQQRFMSDPSLYLLTEGGSLIDRLSKAEWEQLSAYASDRGVPSYMAAKMKPWFLGLSISVPPCALPDVRSGAKGLDYMLEDLAKDQGLSVRSLDQTETLLKLMAGQPLEDQMRDLRKSLALGMIGRTDVGTDYGLYFRQEHRMMWKMSLHQVRAQAGSDVDWVEGMIAEMETSFLHERNRQWAPTIVKAAADGPTLFAVGAGHLFGETGVLAELDRAGFVLSRLPLSID